MAKLRSTQVSALGPGRHGDGDGLYLLVKESGARSWLLRVQVAGRRRDIGLGSTSIVSLADAREKAREGKKLALAGLDPAFEWRRSIEPIPTFEEAAARYYAQAQAGWRNGKHKAQWINTLKTYAFPHIGKLRVDLINAADIHRVLLPIWTTKAETGRRVRQRIGTTLNYAHGCGWRQAEAPMRAVDALMTGIKQPRRTHFASMPYVDVPTFFAALRRGTSTSGSLALQFLILTAARSGEVRGATWGEIDEEKAVWTVPAKRMKAGEEHRVPLTPAAQNVIARAKEISSHAADAPIFPGLKRKPLSDMTLTKVLRDRSVGSHTVHGFRSSFRDWVAEQTRFPGEWAEAALAHSQTNRVEAAYRRTKFFEQRKEVMSAWSAFVCELVS